MIEDPANFDVLTNDNEKNQRVQLCNSCERKTRIDNDDICDACACPISYVVQYKFKICPLKKWDI